MRKEADDLILRPFRAEDVKDALRYLSDPVTMRFIELPFDEEKTEAFLRQCALGKNPPVLAVEEAGEVIGHAIFHPFDGESWEIILAMSLTGWIGMARFIRNQIIIIRDREYNLASRCLGTPVYRIILRNLLPYLVSVVMLRMALSIPEAIGSEVFITYIGLGLPATIPSLGNLINEGRTLMMSPNLRYQLIYPTIVLSIVTISFYVVGNAFSDAADPKNHRHR